MLRRNKNNENAQTMMEYTLIIGIILGVLSVMAPMMQRGSQAMTKFVADQIGNQKDSDQRFNDVTRGHLESQYTSIRTRMSTERREGDPGAGFINMIFDDVIYTESNAVVNQGFQAF